MFRQKPDSYSQKDRDKFSEPAHQVYEAQQEIANPPGGCLFSLILLPVLWMIR